MYLGVYDGWELGYSSYFLRENFFRSSEQTFCEYWIRLTRNARICNARSVKIGYLDRRPLHEIVYEYDRKQFHRLVYVAFLRVILIRYLILYVFVDHGTYYKFYFKKLKRQ